MNTVHRVRTDQLTWRQVEDEVVVLDLRGSVYFSLNGTGALLWHRLVEGSTSEDLAAHLVAEFGLGPAEAAEDVAAFVARLRGLDLVE